MLTTKSFITVTAATIGGLASAYMLGLPLAVGFSTGLLLLAILMLRGGLSVREALHLSLQGALHTKEVVLILLFVSLLIPTWSAGGMIDAMIGFGLHWFSADYFLTSSFLLSGIIALILGTSTGTLSAVGIPVIGMAMQLDIPLPMAAGALVSGAFVGDRGSPFSSAFRLVADSSGITPRKLGRAILPTTVCGALTAILFFLAADRIGGWGHLAANVSAEGAPLPEESGFWLYLPPILLVGTMLLRLGTRWAFTLAILSGIAIGSWHTGIPASAWPATLWNGWTDGTGHTAKGMLHMIDLVLLIALAGSFNGLLERSGVIGPIVQKAFASGASLAGSTWRAGLFGLALDLVSCTQTLPIMMSGRHLRSVWESRFGLAHLGRVVADTSLLFAALVPWNMLAILCGTILGVPVADYIPFAVYVWSIPVFTFLYSSLYSLRIKSSYASK